MPPVQTLATHAHRIAAILATLVMAAFFASTVLVEMFGSAQAVASVKAWIVTPGLWILIPAMAVTGGSGFFLSRTRQGRLPQVKGKRMRWIAANGVLVLVPCAILLDRWAAAGAIDATFYVVQTMELMAGAVNLCLMGLNVRDGLRLAGRIGRRQSPGRSEPAT